MNTEAISTTPSAQALRLSYDEVIDSLTGYDEQEIETRFGGDISLLLRTNPTKASRALVYVLEKRRFTAVDTRDPAGKAYAAAMEARVVDLPSFFGDDIDELIPEEPETEQGKEPAAHS